MRKVFFSFPYRNDLFRASVVRNSWGGRMVQNLQVTGIEACGRIRAPETMGASLT